MADNVHPIVVVRSLSEGGVIGKGNRKTSNINAHLQKAHSDNEDIKAFVLNRAEENGKKLKAVAKRVVSEISAVTDDDSLSSSKKAKLTTTDKTEATQTTACKTENAHCSMATTASQGTSRLYPLFGSAPATGFERRSFLQLAPHERELVNNQLKDYVAFQPGMSLDHLQTSKLRDLLHGTTAHSSDGSTVVLGGILRGCPLPNRKTMATHIKTRHTLLTMFIKEEIHNSSQGNNFPPFVSIQQDGWKSPNKQSYIGITATLITKKWELRSLHLGLVNVTDIGGKGASLRQADECVHSIFNRYQLTSKHVLASTSDTASAAMALSRHILSSLKEESLNERSLLCEQPEEDAEGEEQEKGQKDESAPGVPASSRPCMQCGMHVLSLGIGFVLGVNNALGGENAPFGSGATLVKAGKKIATTFSRNPKVVRELQEIPKSNHTFGKFVHVPVYGDTRIGGVCSTFARIVLNGPLLVFYTTPAMNPNANENLFGIGFDLQMFLSQMREAEGILAPLSELIFKIQGSTYVTGSFARTYASIANSAFHQETFQLIETSSLMKKTETVAQSIALNNFHVLRGKVPHNELSPFGKELVERGKYIMLKRFRKIPDSFSQVSPYEKNQLIMAAVDPRFKDGNTLRKDWQSNESAMMKVLLEMVYDEYKEAEKKQSEDKKKDGEIDGELNVRFDDKEKVTEEENRKKKEKEEEEVKFVHSLFMVDVSSSDESEEADLPIPNKNEDKKELEEWWSTTFSFFKKGGNCERFPRDHRKMKEEKSIYTIIDMLEDIDVLAFWSAYETRFPTISKIAMAYLAMPLSTATQESAFSLAKRNMTAQQQQQSDSLFEARTVLHLNEDFFYENMYSMELEMEGEEEMEVVAVVGDKQEKQQAKEK